MNNQNQELLAKFQVEELEERFEFKQWVAQATVCPVDSAGNIICPKVTFK